MIDRIWLDGEGRPLLTLHRMTQAQALWVRTEDLPEVRPVGTVEEVPGTGVNVYVGESLLVAGDYTVSVGTAGQTHADAFALQREVMRFAVQARAVQRTGEGVLHLARFTGIKRSFKGSALLGGQVDVTFRAAVPYWITAERVQDVAVGQATSVYVAGAMRAALRVTITAGSAAVTNPSILSDAGLTTWLGTLAAGQVLVIDGCPGRWAVTAAGADASLRLTGPQPYLEAGNRSVTIAAAGATAQIEWQEGEL